MSNYCFCNSNQEIEYYRGGGGGHGGGGGGGRGYGGRGYGGRGYGGRGYGYGGYYGPGGYGYGGYYGPGGYGYGGYYGGYYGPGYYYPGYYGTGYGPYINVLPPNVVSDDQNIPKNKEETGKNKKGNLIPSGIKEKEKRAKKSYINSEYARRAY